MKKILLFLPAFLFAEESFIGILYKADLLFDKILHNKTFWSVYGIVFLLLFLFGRYYRVSALFFLRILFYMLIILSIDLSVKLYFLIYDKIPNISGLLYTAVVITPFLISLIFYYVSKNSKKLTILLLSLVFFIGAMFIFFLFGSVKIMVISLIIIAAFGIMVAGDVYFVYLLKNIRWFKK